jgi:protein transport protein SEC61 subunit gamma-like protein
MTIMPPFSGFISESIRVLKLARKPRKDEYMLIAKVTGAGMLLIGAIGAIITLIAHFLKGGALL